MDAAPGEKRVVVVVRTSTMSVGDGFLGNQAAVAPGVSWGGLYNDGVGLRDDRLMRLLRTAGANLVKSLS